MEFILLLLHEESIAFAISLTASLTAAATVGCASYWAITSIQMYKLRQEQIIKRMDHGN